MSSPLHHESSTVAPSSPSSCPAFSDFAVAESSSLSQDQTLAASEVELKHCLRDLLQSAEALAAHETELLKDKRDLVLRRRELLQSKASYSRSDWKDLMMICVLQKRAILRDQDIKSIPSTVPLDPTFRAKTVLMFYIKDYFARQKWRKIWTAYRSHREGQAAIARIKAVDAIYHEQHTQLQELLDIENMFLLPLTLMADAGFIQRQDVINAFHVAAILTLQQVLKALLEQEKSDWPRSRYARVFATKASLMQQLYCTYASDTNVMLQSLRRLLATPIVSQFLAEVAVENPSLFSPIPPGLDSAAAASNLEVQIQKLLERPLSHVSRILAAVRACLPHIPPDHFLHEDTTESVVVLDEIQKDIVRIKQDATLALIALDATVTTSCTHLFFCNPGTSIKKLGDVEFLLENSGTFGGSSWKPATLLLCDGLMVVFRATGYALQ